MYTAFNATMLYDGEREEMRTGSLFPTHKKAIFGKYSEKDKNKVGQWRNEYKKRTVCGVYIV